MRTGTTSQNRGHRTKSRRKASEKGLKAAASILLAVVGCIAALSACGTAPGDAEAAPAPQPQAASVVLYTVEKKDLGARKEYIGKVEAIQTVDIRPQIPGEIAAVHFKEGSIVKEGDLLFTLDPAEYQATVALRQAELAKAEASSATASRYHERLKNIGKDGVSASNIDTAAGDAAQAKAQVAQAKAQLRLAQIDLGRTKIKAPITGRIGKAGMTKGNYVTPSDSVLANIVQVDPIRVSFSLPDREFLQIMEHSKTVKEKSVRTTLRLTDGSAYPVPGERDFEDNTVDERTGTITLRLRFGNNQGLLLPGSMVRVEIAASSPIRDIMVPQKALAADGQGDYVYVVDSDSIAHRRSVTLGAESGSMRQVTSGLMEGDTIIRRGLQSVRDGMPVSPMPSDPGGTVGKKS